jgi:hypothetical protein
MSSANYVYSHRSEASSLCCGQDEEHDDAEECTSTQKSLDDQPLACRWHQTRAGGVLGKTSPTATSPPTQSGGAESVSAGGGKADHESACRDAELALDSNMHGDNVELIPESASASPAQQVSSSGFRGEDWNVYSQRWSDRIRSRDEKECLRSFGDEYDKEAAAWAYDKSAIEQDPLDQLNFDDYNLPSASAPASKRESSRFRGVGWNKKSSKWRARLTVQGVKKSLGWFNDEEAAARAYDKAAIVHGLLDQLNFDDYEHPRTASASPSPQRDISRFQGVSWHKTSGNCRA